MIIFSSCSKGGSDQPGINESKQAPRTIDIISTNKVGLNKFEIGISVASDSTFTFDDYGLVYSKEIVNSLGQPNIHIIRQGAIFKQSLVTTKVVIDSLEGNTIYHLKAYVKKGDSVYFSAEKQVTPEGLRIQGFEPVRNGFYADRGELVTLYLNDNDNNSSTINTRLKIGGIDVPIMGEINDLIVFTIPKILNAGKQSIEIEKDNGLKLSIKDTLEILRGRYSYIGTPSFAFRSLFGCAQVGNSGYLIGGLENPNTSPVGWHNEVLKFDLASKQWTDVNSPYPKDYFVDGVSFEVNNKIYCFPGKDNAHGYNTNMMHEYDPATNRWTDKAVFPGQARIRASGFTINGKIYILGGFDMFTMNDLWEYDPSTDRWTQKSDFAPGDDLFPALFVYNNKAIVFTGGGAFMEYDPSNNQWRQLPPPPSEVKPAYRSVCFTVGNKAYMSGGYQRMLFGWGYGNVGTWDSWELDLPTMKWTRIAANRDKQATPNNFDLFYLQSAPYIKDGKVFIYDWGKMYEFTAD